jgi:hypothetical protein
MHKHMRMTFVSRQWVNSRPQYLGSCNEPCILWKGGVTGMDCRLIQTRLGSSPLSEGGNSLGSLNQDYLGRPCDAPGRPSN